jgi:cell division protein FtsW (lipid II flippase)
MNKKISLIAFPLFFILAATRSIENIKWISYSAPLFYLFFIFDGLKDLKSKELKLSLLLITTFGLWAMVTSCWSTYPRESYIRSLVFIVSSSSLILGGYCWVKYFREKEFGFLIPLNILLLLVSLFSLMTKIPYDYWAGYGYGLKSFWGHQNILASLIIFSIPGIFMLPVKDKKINIVITSFLLILNIYILILTHSRTSLAVIILSAFLFALLSKRIKIFAIIMLIFLTLIITYMVNNNFQSHIKNYLFKTEISLLDRKMPVISASYEAAVIGGWKGLGFGVSDNTVLSNLLFNVHYHFEGVRLVREKAVSIYALIEETGWIGLILFLFFVLYLLYLTVKTYLNTMSWSSVMMVCLLIGMSLHAQLEGWWLGVGSVQFPIFMALAGITIGKIGIKAEQ